MRAVNSAVLKIQQVGAAHIGQQGCVQARPDAGLGSVPQATPGHHPSEQPTVSAGTSRQATPVRSTYRIPASAARSGTRSRPG